MSELLAGAVEKWTALALAMRDSDLEIHWAWKDYEEEGIRFAFFRTYEDLRTLAAQLWDARQKQGLPPSETQLILGNAHTAFCDLQGALLGVTASEFDTPPAPGEWPLRKVLEHIILTDMSFFVVFKNGLKNHRMDGSQLEKINEAFWEQTTGASDPWLEALFAGPMENILAFHRKFHARILNELADIRDEELDKAALFWESGAMPLRFRLHRFDSHMSQHTIQVEKALAGLGKPVTEINRLMRLVYNARAGAENAQIGADGFGGALVAACAAEITARAGEVSTCLQAVKP